MTCAEQHGMRDVLRGLVVNAALALAKLVAGVLGHTYVDDPISKQRPGVRAALAADYWRVSGKYDRMALA